MTIDKHSPSVDRKSFDDLQSSYVRDALVFSLCVGPLNYVVQSVNYVFFVSFSLQI